MAKYLHPKNKITGFSIIELIIVMVIIGILATVVFVSYRGLSKSATEAIIKSDLSNAIGRLEVDFAKNGGKYPATTELANGGNGLAKSSNVEYQYSVNGNSYCLTATAPGASAFHVLSTSGSIESGTCPGDFEYGATGWKQVAGGGGHMCGIKIADNLAYCWGAGWQGTIGDGFASERLVPTAVSTSGVLSGKTIKYISTGYSHSCAIASDDKAYCWGLNDYGQLGDGTMGTNRLAPVEVVNTSGPLMGKTIKTIAAGTNHTCAIASDDNVYCWGRNYFGELGNGNNDQSSLPVAVMTSGVLGGKKTKSLSVGYYYNCMIASDDLPYCWGQGMYGILGNGVSTSSNVPVTTAMSGPLSGKNAKSIIAGYYHTCVIANDDLGYCWGYNGGNPGSFDDSAGALGNGSTTNSMTPVAISMTGNLVGKTLKKIDSDSYHSCALASDDLVYCWGTNFYGELGINSTVDPITVPTPVYTGAGSALNGKAVRSFATGDLANCVIANDGLGSCWGFNYGGVYGNNTEGDENSEIFPVSGMNL